MFTIKTKKLIGSVAALVALGAATAGPASAQEQATFYANGSQAEFEAAVGERGLAVDSAENFEDARRRGGLLGSSLLSGPPTGAMDDPLDVNTMNQFFVRGQIPAAFRFQSNRDNTGVAGPNPVGSFGLAISQPGSVGEHGSPTTISSPFTQDGPVSLDVLSVDAAHEAYVLDASLVEFSFVEPGTDPVGGPLSVKVYDEAGASLGSTTVDQDDIGPFLGIVAPEGSEIGRINLSEPGGSELLHSAVAYDADGGADTGVPAPRSNPIEELLEGLGL